MHPDFCSVNLLGFINCPSCFCEEGTKFIYILSTSGREISVIFVLTNRGKYEKNIISTCEISGNSQGLPHMLPNFNLVLI